MSFASLGLPQSLVQKLLKQDFTKPYPIQEKAIPAILSKKDVLGIAKTGSGKTASYVLPILANLLGRRDAEKDRSVDVLVVVPTRELAVQVKDVFYQFSSESGGDVRTLAVYGGVSINPQMKAMFGVNVLVATPGRLLELVESKAVSISEIETLVLDEADKMLNLGFEEEMNQIFALLPQNRQNLLFSATLNKEVKNINKVLLRNPLVINVEETETADIELIEQIAYLIEEEKKGPLLRYIIKENNFEQVLVFVSSTFRADAVVDKLKKNGFDCMAIHSKKSQGARTDALTKFKNGKLAVLVATDLLGRGIDIQGLPCVINYELPRSPKDYIHRIGRTGRAEMTGKAISILTTEDLHHFKVIQKKMKKRVDLTYTDDLNLSSY